MMVFDTSAIYKSISSGKASHLVDQYTSYLAFFELGNIVWKNSVLGKVYTQKEAKELLSVCELVLEKMRVNYVDLNNVYHIAAQHHISFYDATFVCLAIDLKCPLVTLDRKLSVKVKSLLTILAFEDVSTM